MLRERRDEIIADIEAAIDLIRPVYYKLKNSELAQHREPVFDAQMKLEKVKQILLEATLTFKASEDNEHRGSRA